MATTLYKDINQFNPTDREYSHDERAVYQAVVNIIQTRTGERLFRPDFGVDIDSYLFETMDANTEQAVLTIIASAVERFENRVSIDFAKSEVRAKAETNELEIKLVFDIEGIDDQSYQLIESIRA
jgi:phage baseplate assembly protein W